MSGIETVVPVYGDDPLRVRNRQAVLAHLYRGTEVPYDFGRIRVNCYPVWIEEGDSPGQARNRGAENVVSPLLLFNDADTICPWPQILEACKLAMAADGLVFAYDLYVRLDEAGTHSFIVNGNMVENCTIDRVIHNSGSMGCVAISRDCFDRVGGFDESYQGWGYEDLDFAVRCDALWPNRRVSGPVYHLWHGDRRGDDSPSDSDPVQVGENYRRWAASALAFDW